MGVVELDYCSIRIFDVEFVFKLFDGYVGMFMGYDE